MSVWQDLIDAGIGLCKAKCDEAAKKAKCVGARIGLFLVATILSLWGTALLLAAVFLGVLPHVGGAWAAVICAGTAFLAAAFLGLIAMSMRK
jgi:hypothetical protein